MPPLVLTVAVIVAVVLVAAVKNVNTALLPLPLMVAPEGTVQVTKLAGTVAPVFVTTVAVTVPGGVTLVVERLMVIVPIVPVMTSIGTVAVCPPELAVTVAVPPAPAIGATVTDDPLVVAKQLLSLNEMTAQFVSVLVQFGEMVELLPLTSRPLAEIVRSPLLVAELRTAVVGLSVMLASEFGETKKPLQPTINPATAARPRSARIALPFRDIAPPEHTFSS